MDLCIKYQKSMVIGTTGFNQDQLSRLNEKATQIPVVFAANFSSGVTLSLRLLEMASKVMGDDADISQGCAAKMKLVFPLFVAEMSWEIILFYLLRKENAWKLPIKPQVVWLFQRALSERQNG